MDTRAAEPWPCQPPVRAGLETAPERLSAAPLRIVSAANVLATGSSVGRYAVSAPLGPCKRAGQSGEDGQGRCASRPATIWNKEGATGRPGRATAPRVPQPVGSLLYELLAGHLDRQPGELVFLTRLGVARGMPGPWQAKDLPSEGQ